MARIACVVALALFLVGGARAAVVGPQRVLVVQATWGAELFPPAVVQKAYADASDLLRRASFGRAWLDVTIAPPIAIPGYSCSLSSPLVEDSIDQIRVPARAAGYDVAAPDHVVYMIPSPVFGATACPNISYAGLRDVVLVGSADPIGIVHELGHTFGLGHATTAACPTCEPLPYGDPWSPMGHGRSDFTVFEKVQLGWALPPVDVRTSGTYTVAVDRRASSAPAALRVHGRDGDLWIEYTTSPFRWVLVRRVVGTVRPDTVLFEPLRAGVTRVASDVTVQILQRLTIRAVVRVRLTAP